MTNYLTYGSTDSTDDSSPVLMYLDYSEYQELGGTLDEATFNDLEFTAEVLINLRTFNRLRKEKSPNTAIKRCVYALIKAIYLKQNALVLGQSDSENSTPIASQSNDGVSISYNVLSASEVLELMDKEVDRIITQYLSNERNSIGQRLLYRGLYPNE